MFTVKHLLAINFFVILVTSINVFDIHSEIERALLKVLRDYFEENSSLLVAYDTPDETNQKSGLYPNQDPDMLQNIIKTLNVLGEWTVHISNGNVSAFNKDFLGPRLQNCLIFLNEQTVMDEELFQTEIYQLRGNPLWDPYGRVIVILETTSEETENREWSRRVIDKFWKYTKNDDVLVMIPNSSNGIEFFTWFPYRPPDCSEVKTIAYLDTWAEGKFQLGLDLFPEKITSDLQGCDLVMVTASCMPYVIDESENDTLEFVRGIEIEIIKALSKAMHFNIKLIPTPDDFWITTTEDNEIAGAFKLLSNQEVDLAFSCIMLNYERYHLAEPLPPYFHDSLIWLVPTPNLKSHVYDVFRAFPIYFWFFMLITLISASFVVILIIRYESGFILDYMGSILKIMGMSVSAPVHFSTTGKLLRTVVAIFLLYSMHITTGYQASLFGLFCTSDYEGAFETIQEAVDAGLYVYLRESTKLMYNQSDHELWNTILQPGRYEYLYDYDEAFPKIADEKSAIALYVESTASFIIDYWYSNKLGHPKILYLPERFISYPVTMFMSPGSPLFPVFHTKMHRLIASGLVDNWAKDFMLTDDYNPFKEVENKALGLEHFSGAFCVFFGLLILACLVFLMEILCFAFYKRKKEI